MTKIEKAIWEIQQDPERIYKDRGIITLALAELANSTLPLKYSNKYFEAKMELRRD